MKYYIVTGSSRGLGEGIAKKLISAETHLFCISRRKNESLINNAADKGCLIDYFEYDFTKPENLGGLMQAIMEKVNFSDAECFYIYNNAGVVHPIKPVEECNENEMINNISVNLLTPMIISSEFIKYTEKLTCDKRIINISSGASHNPYHGWSSYCSSKAGIDMFTRTVGLEQSKKINPCTIISIAPGVIDTDMQKSIRETKKEDFEKLEKFLKLKNEGNLLQPDYAAQKIIELSQMKDLKQGEIYDIYDYLK